MKVLITGASGAIASALAAYLRQKGHLPVLVSRRTPVHLSESSPLANSVICWPQLTPAFMLANRFEAIVNLAGAPMIRYWTERNKAEILSSRIECTTRIYTLVRQLPLSVRPECIVNASSVAIYSTVSSPVSEWSRPDRQSFFFQARVWHSVEDTIRKLRLPGVRTVITRIGVVIGADPFMQAMLTASRLYMNFIFGSGNQQISWVAQSDLLRIFEFLLSHETKAGVYNAVAPSCISARELGTEIAGCTGRRRLLRIPAGTLKLLLGELATNFLVSADVRPQRLLDDGFCWKHTDFALAVKVAARDLGYDVAGADSTGSLQISPNAG